MTFPHVHYIDRFNPSWVSIEKGKVVFREKFESGDVAEVSFATGRNRVLAIRHLDNMPPLKWLNNLKCADGAILEFDADARATIHLIELKSKLTKKEWGKVKLQYEGMLFNVLSVMAVANLLPPKSVVLHISFSEEAFDANQSADLIFLKSRVGGGSLAPSIDDYQSGKVAIGGWPDVELRKIHRDPNPLMASARL